MAAKRESAVKLGRRKLKTFENPICQALPTTKPNSNRPQLQIRSPQRAPEGKKVKTALWNMELLLKKLLVGKLRRGKPPRRLFVDRHQTLCSDSLVLRLRLEQVVSSGVSKASREVHGGENGMQVRMKSLGNASLALSTVWNWVLVSSMKALWLNQFLPWVELGYLFYISSNYSSNFNLPELRSTTHLALSKSSASFSNFVGLFNESKKVWFGY